MTGHGRRDTKSNTAWRRRQKLAPFLPAGFRSWELRVVPVAPFSLLLSSNRLATCIRSALPIMPGTHSSLFRCDEVTCQSCMAATKRPSESHEAHVVQIVLLESRGSPRKVLRIVYGEARGSFEGSNFSAQARGRSSRKRLFALTKCTTPNPPLDSAPVVSPKQLKVLCLVFRLST